MTWRIDADSNEHSNHHNQNKKSSKNNREMRESERARARSAVFHNHELRKEDLHNRDSRRDFREGLVSIFIDNLNPCMDSIYRVMGDIQAVRESERCISII